MRPTPNMARPTMLASRKRAVTSIWMFPLLVAAVLAGLFIAASIAAAAEQKAHADVTWHATGTPGFIQIDGDGGKATGVVTVDGDVVSGSFACQLDDFTTGIALRDRHMREKYLETGKHPVAVITIDPVDLGKGTRWTGKLTLKGVTKPIAGDATRAGPKAFAASFDVNLDDFPVGVPSYLGVTVAKTVHVAVRGTVE